MPWIARLEMHYLGPDHERDEDDFLAVAKEFCGDAQDPQANYAVRVTAPNGESQLIDTETWEEI